MKLAPMGRRKGQTAYPGKTVQSTLSFQPVLRAALLKASARSGHSIGDVFHLCCLEGFQAERVTSASFRGVMKRLERQKSR